MAIMTKSDLRTGMFGVDNRGDVFVVVGNKLIYEDGLFDTIDDMSDTLDYENGDGIVALYEADCYKQVKEGKGKLIWERKEERADEVKDDKGAGAVTITEEQFLEAVKAANAKFMAIGKENPDAPVTEVMEAIMGLQNLTFGAVLAEVLFGATDSE